MHNYRRNSPEAAARLVALALIADGNVCRSEVDAMQRRAIESLLGLPVGGFARALQTLCEDLLLAESAGTGLDEDLLAALVRDITDPLLQQRVLSLAMEAAAADGTAAPGEAHVLLAMARGWGLDWHVPPVLLAPARAAAMAA